MDIKTLSIQLDLVEKSRLTQLDELALLIKKELKQNGKANVIVICTHNSRRSQLAEMWINYLSAQFKIPNIKAYSGGTEATAFNPRMVKAVKDFGFDVKMIEEGDNPHYQFLEQDMFSKKYDDDFNPQRDFIAIMVCDSADEACPIVHGATHRFALKYKDPKEFDDTPYEAQAYSDKVQEIGREMIYLMEQFAEI